MHSYLEYWHTVRNMPNKPVEYCTFFLDFITQLGIMSAHPDKLMETDIVEWMHRLEYDFD